MNRSDNAPCPDGCDTQPVKTEASIAIRAHLSFCGECGGKCRTPVEVRFAPEEVTMRMECNNHRDRESCARSRGKARHDESMADVKHM